MSHGLEEAIETNTEEVLEHSGDIETAESSFLTQSEDIGGKYIFFVSQYPKSLPLNLSGS